MPSGDDDDEKACLIINCHEKGGRGGEGFCGEKNPSQMIARILSNDRLPHTFEYTFTRGIWSEQIMTMMIPGIPSLKSIYQRETCTHT